MKMHIGALAIVLALGCLTAVPLIAQDDHHDQAYNQDREERSYYSNPYYQRGWQNGLDHKRAEYHWKSDDDRRAYEAGYAHGERGEKWRDPDDHHHDDDHHDDHQ